MQLVTALATLCTLLTLPALFGASEASAQEGGEEEVGRFVVVLDVTGRRGDRITDDFRTLFANHPHIVFNQQDFVDAGERQGVTEERFWDIPSKLSEVSKAENIDAVIAADLQRNDDRRYELTVFVFQARSGEIVGETTVDIGRKPRLSDDEVEELAAMAHEFVMQTGPLKPESVEITINTTPDGALVLRDNQVQGQTPLTLEVDYAETTETWNLLYENEPAGTVDVDLSKGGSYTVVLGEEGDGSDNGDDGEPAGAFSTGAGLPILDVGISVDITGRVADVTTSDPQVGLSYNSSAYPVFNIVLDFFPFTIFSENGYLGGIGITARGGFGTLTSEIPVLLGGPPLTPETTECSGSSAGPDFIECPTTHSEFGIGALYRLLLQDDAEGDLDGDGMALDFSISYTWLVFDVATNPTYEGHGYQGLELGLGYSTPLVLDGLRLSAQFAFTQLLAFGEANMIATWGTSATGFGIGWGLDVSYEFFAGMFAKLGYTGQFMSTTYEGVGCQGQFPDFRCTLSPSSSVASDQFHQGVIRFGYRLH